MLIALTNGGSAIIDDEDYHLIEGLRFWAFRRPNLPTYAHTKVNGKTKALHSIVMGAKKGQMVDHQNRDGLDCQRGNMRFCTSTQNNRNRSKSRKNKSSHYKGVWLEAGVWRANIRVKNKTRHLGQFDTEVEAAVAYNEAAKKLFGEFACLNIIPLAAAA